jgi:Co/Zn/Cd efflux system component
LAALAYTYARKHANNPAFTFGTGKPKWRTRHDSNV